MGLQVIGAGFGRTGTMSLKLALEQLGYVKCHHMLEVFANPAQSKLWQDIAEGATPDWDKAFEGFAAAVDFPSCACWRELAARYPEAKVVLTVRSSESWFASASQTIFAIGKVAPPWMLWLVPHLKRIFGMHEALIRQRVFEGDYDTKAHAIAIYDRHNAAVKAAIPAERLLVYELKQGWAPLCAFLGKPVPASPMPNVNDLAEFQGRIRLFKFLNWAPLLLALVIAAAVWGVAALT